MLIYFIRYCLGFLFILFLSASLFSQKQTEIGSWMMFFNQSRITEKWGIHLESQYRSYAFSPNTEQLLLRAGINHHLSKSCVATIGFAKILNYSIDKEAFDGLQLSENRLWEQYLIKSKWRKLSVEQRLRLEQRFLNTSEKSQYLNRLRYLIRFTRQLNKFESYEKYFFISVYNELFLRSTSSLLDRNRLYSSIGYQVSSTANLQVGVLAQTLNKITRPYAQIALIYNFERKNK